MSATSLAMLKCVHNQAANNSSTLSGFQMYTLDGLGANDHPKSVAPLPNYWWLVIHLTGCFGLNAIWVVVGRLSHRSGPARAQEPTCETFTTFNLFKVPFLTIGKILLRASVIFFCDRHETFLNKWILLQNENITAEVQR